MSQSASDAELDMDDEEDKPLYAYDKIYHDAKEKIKIQAMGEIERETIIAQRTEEVDRHEQNRQLHRLVASRGREDRKLEAKAKRKAAEAGLDDNQRKSSRQRTKVGGESKTLIDKYKLQRAEKNQRDEKNRQNRSARTPSPSGAYSEDDADGEDDDYYDRRYPKKRSPSPAKDDPPAELNDIQHARIGRDNFAQVCQNPTFKQAVTGCFARVNLGPGRTPGVNEYRLCQIDNIETGKIYAMTGSNGQQFLTDKYILASHGKAKRAWSFLECSMSRFTEDEWRRYRVTMANDDVKMPTQGQVNKKLEDLNKLINHKWLDSEITGKLNAQNDLMAIVTKAKEREAIMDQLIEARRKRNFDLEQQLEDKLQNIVPMKLAMGTSIVKKETPRVNLEQERLTALNRKNNQLNSENIRKAQLAEMRARRIKQAPKPATAIANKAIDDLFGDGSDISRAGTPVNGSGTPARSGTPNPTGNGTTANGTPTVGTPRSNTPVPYKQVGKKKGIPSIRKAAFDDEIIGSIDLGLEIEL
jgi:RNA polymerase-associated protein RTF1